MILVISAISIKVYTYFDEHSEFLNSTPFERRTSISTDGPYFIYKSNQIERINIKKQNNSYVLERKSFSKDSIKKYSHDVNVFSYHPSITGEFKVNLKDSIVAPESIYETPSRMLVVSDIEGNWYAFKKLLIESDVVDENLNWKFGDGHLVLVGDFVDRGLNVTPSALVNL